MADRRGAELDDQRVGPLPVGVCLRNKQRRHLERMRRQFDDARLAVRVASGNA